MSDTPIGPELWGIQPETGLWVQIADGSNTDVQVASFIGPYKRAGWTGLRKSNPFTESSKLLKAMRRILPYLEWTISDESPGYHPTMPSAVAAFKDALEQSKVRLPSTAELIAALRNAPQEVKVLEWVQTVEGYWWFADFYKIETNLDGIFTVAMLVPSTFGKNRMLGRFATFDEAKAAAQTDFETRTLSALLVQGESRE